jgi:hypothetical protein
VIVLVRGCQMSMNHVRLLLTDIWQVHNLRRWDMRANPNPQNPPAFPAVLLRKLIQSAEESDSPYVNGSAVPSPKTSSISSRGTPLVSGNTVKSETSKHLLSQEISFSLTEVY